MLPCKSKKYTIIYSNELLIVEVKRVFREVVNFVKNLLN